MADFNMFARWTFHNPVRVTAGVGVLERLHELAPEGKVLLITTAGFTRRGMTDRLMALLGEGRVLIHDWVTPNPELDDLEVAAENLKDSGLASIVALGGGSVLDAAKVLAVTLLSDSERPLDHALRQGNAHTWIKRLPVIAIPTTSGTGAEVTPFATVWDSTTHKKHSVNGDNLYPTHALLDPTLTLTLPRQETLYTSLDAISHALESLWNKNRTPVSEALTLQALNLANESLPVILEEPDNLGQRTRMQQASTLAGMAISQTRTAIAHSISYPLTSRYGVPHGLACSFTLVAIWEQCQHGASEILKTDIVKKTIERLKGLNLPHEINKYIRDRNVAGLSEEMFVQASADNYIMSMDRFAVERILQASLQE